MTLGEVLAFMKELGEGKYSEYDVPVRFYYKKLDQEVQETVISNESNFGIFLGYLYCTYRKIEMQMEKAGYPNILPDIESKEKSSLQIYLNLGKAKEEYKSTDKTNFLNMYPALKKLFFCYSDYIRYSVSHTIDIDEGDYLPGTWDEIQPWLQKLNTWFPMKVNAEWINCMNSFIGAPNGFDQVIKALHGTNKFKNLTVIKDSNMNECYIGEETGKALFGLVNMENAKKDPVPENSKILELDCPNECTPDLRKWICKKCGEYVRIAVTENRWQVLFCTCGSKRYTDKFLLCHHPSHQVQEPFETRHRDQVVHPPVPDTDEPQSHKSNRDGLTYLIHQQLRKLQLKNGKATDSKILDAIIYLSSEKEEEKIESSLRKLQDMKLDGDTNNLIKKYLKKDS